MSNKSYIGYTTNFTRRLRQHKGIIKGGAKYTRQFQGNIEVVALVSGFPSKRVAMSYEWHAKRRRQQRFGLILLTHARLDSFIQPLTNTKFQHALSCLTLQLKSNADRHILEQRNLQISITDL